MTEDLYAGKSILVVSHDRLLAESLKKTVDQISLRISLVPTEDSQNALERCRMKHFDIVVLDETMPKLSGSFLIHRILEIKNQEPPHYFLLAHEPSKKPDLPPLDNIMTKELPWVTSEAQKWLEEHLKKLATGPAKVIQKTVKIDVNFINPFIDGTIKVIETTCNTKCKRDKVFLRTDDVISGDISAMIGMTSPYFRGSMGIAFERRTYLGLVGEMLGSKANEINNENQDGAGEICNQVFGLAKAKLNEMGYQVQPAIPSIIVGQCHRIRHLVGGPVIAVRFDTDFGFFTIEAAITG